MAPSTTFDDERHGLETAILHYMGSVQEHLMSTAAAFDLSPQQAFALRAIDSTSSMSDLATLMHCDASNVTGIVDRLEARGFIERRPDSADRRVKRLIVTDVGRAHRARLETQLLSTFPGVARLTEAQRGELFALLTVALGDTDRHLPRR